ncbi:hypothetical protein VIGAN_06012400 [Vigna angularis var. angularis]|uniref:Uncharacterized protein n=1 Tax=Vigna angularis var. angularis TaxID=157739 RepID=A0A0S3S8V3_PHAAN|nr:hypothetical protein VIGAN_06012400 [Vigna angularis var. angularis]
MINREECNMKTLSMGGRRLKNRETMGVELVAPSPPPPRSEGKIALLQSPKIPFSLALLFTDALLVTLVDAHLFRYEDRLGHLHVTG